MIDLLAAVYLNSQEPKNPPPPQQDPAGGIITMLLSAAGGFLSTQKKESTTDQQLTVNVNLDSDKLAPQLILDAPQNASDYSWVYQVLKLPFRVLSGKQGSGKSTLERFMIAKLKQEGWHIVCINPETNPAVWRGVEVLADPRDISQFFKDFLQWVCDRQQEARDNGIDEDDYYDLVKQRSGQNGLVAIFLMETNTYEAHGVEPDAWANFLKQCLTNIRKWGFTACFTAHSDNQTSVASKLSGFSKLLDGQPRIECIAIPHSETGEATSSGEAWLKIEGLKDRNPIKIKLHNYPKTKDFRITDERDNETPAVMVDAAIPPVTTNSNVSDIFDVQPSTNRTKSKAEELAEKLGEVCKGEGRIKVSRIPTKSKPIRNWLIEIHGKQDLEDLEQVRKLHVILGILEYQGRASIFGARDRQGLIIPSKDNEFEVI